MTADDDLLPRLRARGDYDPNNDFLCDEAANEIERLNETVRILSEAIQYITSPTMGRPGGVDAELFAETQATDRDARLALMTCIRIARMAKQKVAR